MVSGFFTELNISVKLEMFVLWQSPFLVITGVFVFKSVLQIHLIKHLYRTRVFHDSGSFRAMDIIYPVYVPCTQHRAF